MSWPRRGGFGDDVLSDLLGDVESSAASLASGAVQSIIVESSAFPAIELDNPLAGITQNGDGTTSGTPAPPPLWARIVRPRITVNTSVGQFMIAPGGAPPAFPWLGAALLGVAALAAFGATVLFFPPVVRRRKPDVEIIEEEAPAPKPSLVSQAVSGYRKYKRLRQHFGRRGR